MAKILKSIDELKYASFNQSPVLPECTYEKNWTGSTVNDFQTCVNVTTSYPCQGGDVQV